MFTSIFETLFIDINKRIKSNNRKKTLKNEEELSDQYEHSRCTSSNGQTDRQTDGQGKTNIPPPPIRLRGYKNETKTEIFKIPQYNCFSEHDLIHR